MCCRYFLDMTEEQLLATFGVLEVREYRPRWNVAPFQYAPVVRLRDRSREMVMLRWGLVPAWARDETIGRRTINARVETAAEKPAFRGAWRARRCVVPACGYYEWKTIGEKRKQAYALRPAGEPVFAMAGLWETWGGRSGESVLETFTVLTMEASGSARGVHDRMPVMVPMDAMDAWLADGALLGENAAAEAVVEPVSARVNSPSHDDPELLRVVEPPPEELPGLFEA